MVIICLPIYADDDGIQRKGRVIGRVDLPDGVSLTMAIIDGGVEGVVEGCDDHGCP